MPKMLYVCKICGKEYETCTAIGDQGVFRWQDVACCKEHGALYFAQIEESRKKDEQKKDT